MKTDLGKEGFFFFEIDPREFKIIIGFCQPFPYDFVINHKASCPLL
jgi:hypothetical protein